MIKKSKKILTEISAGELLDKISILEIKLNKIKGKKNLLEIKKEYVSLIKTKKINIKSTPKLKTLIKELTKTNLQLWNIEDKKRNCEKNKKFDSKFILLARKVYLNNDKRAAIKSKINKHLGSNITEIKQYVNY
jgi:hypothetical protein